VRANYELVTKVLGIERLFAATGFARGATMAMQMAVLYPGFMHGLLAVSGSAYWGTTALMRFPILLSLIESCDGWQGGNYDANPERPAQGAA